MNRFSARNNLSRPNAEIHIRNDAPAEVREAVVSIAYGCSIVPTALRQILCTLLARAPNRANWSEFPNVNEEVRGLIDECEWFEIYGFIEMVSDHAARRGTQFDDEINRYFRVGGIGWQLVDNKIEMRGSEAFEAAVRQGQQALHSQRRFTAANELHEALIDLSRRPHAEITGAIQHAMAALECVARDACGSKDTLGDLIRRNPDLFPRPVDLVGANYLGRAVRIVDASQKQDQRPQMFRKTPCRHGGGGGLR